MKELWREKGDPRADPRYKPNAPPDKKRAAKLAICKDLALDPEHWTNKSNSKPKWTWNH